MSSPENASPTADHEFDVFISYTGKDRALAAILQSALERYDIPPGFELSGPRLSVFRYETDMRGSRYYSSIDHLLESSRRLLVVCSPSARASRYVNDEITRFLRRQSWAEVILVIAAGKPNNAAHQEAEKAFPDPLLSDGDWPLAADLSDFEPRRNRLHDPDWASQWHFILAGVLGMPRRLIDEREWRAEQALAEADARSSFEIAGLLSELGRRGEALVRLASAHASAPPSPLRRSLHLATVAAFPELIVDHIVGLSSPIIGGRLAADGSTLVTWDRANVSRLIDVPTGSVLVEATHGDRVVGATFLKNGWAATYSRHNETVFLHASEKPRRWKTPPLVTKVVEAPAGDLIALQSFKAITLWSWTDGQLLSGTDRLNREGVRTAIVFTSDGDRLLAANDRVLATIDRAGVAATSCSSPLVIHQEVPELAAILASTGDTLGLLMHNEDASELSLSVLVQSAGRVSKACVGPELTQLCWVDVAGQLSIRDLLVSQEQRSAPRRSGFLGRWLARGHLREAGASDHRVVVAAGLDPEQTELAFWNGDAVVVAVDKRSASTYSTDGERHWTYAFPTAEADEPDISIQHDCDLLIHLPALDNDVTILDLASGTPVQLCRPPANAVQGITSAEDSGHFAVPCGELELPIHRRTRARPAARIRYYGVAHFAPWGDRPCVAFEGQDEGLEVIDAATGRRAFPPVPRASKLSSLTLSRDGAALFGRTRYGRQHVEAWIADGPEARPLTIGLTNNVRWSADFETGRPTPAAAVSEDARQVAISWFGDIELGIVGSDFAITESLAHTDRGSVTGLWFSPGSGHRLLSRSTNNDVRLWETSTREPVGAPVTFDGPIVGAGFTEGGRVLAWSADGSFAIMDLESGEQVRCRHPEQRVLEGGINDLRASADKRLLLSAGQDHTVRSWDAVTGEEVGEPTVFPFPVKGLAPSDDTERVLAWGANTVTLWSPWNGAKLAPDVRTDGIVISAFWTRDNERIAVMDEREVRLYDPESAQCVAGPWHHRGASIRAAFVDRSLVTWTTDGRAAVHDTATDGATEDLRVAAERATGLGFDPNRRSARPLSAGEFAALRTADTEDVLTELYESGGSWRCSFPTNRLIPDDELRNFLRDEGLFDRLMNPVGRPDDFELAETGFVHHPTERLLWEAGGSAEPVDVHGAVECVRAANERRQGDRSGWRLPKVAEAAATLSPQLGDRRRHQAPPFSGAQEVIWTCDTPGERLAWIVDYASGQLVAGTVSELRAYVRLVCDLSEPLPRRGDVVQRQADSDGGLSSAS
jgi:WD40 repeat protein